MQFDAALGLLVLHAGGKPAHVAQLVEHVLGKDEVTGSIRATSCMSQDGLVSYGIEGNDRRRFLGEIRIGNINERSKSVISQIGAEDDWVHVRADTKGVDRDIRAA